MASAKKKDEGGAQHFAEAARTSETTSSDGRHSEIKQAPSTGPLDGTPFVQVRGKPTKE